MARDRPVHAVTALQMPRAGDKVGVPEALADRSGRRSGSTGAFEIASGEPALHLGQHEVTLLGALGPFDQALRAA